jgi:membrane associated rhomboid family serine protease
MLSDRPYMRDDYQPEKTSVVVWLICAIVAAFLLQNILGRWFGTGPVLEQYLALSAPHLQSGHVWTLLTYCFLHSPSNLLDLLFTLIGLFFFGREVLAQTGPRRFLGLFAGMTIGGGLLWAITHWQSGGMLFGAAAAVYGLLAVFACFQPNRAITLLLFFVLPVSIKPKHLALIAVFIDLCGFLFYEILRQPSPFGLAHSAHLGGMAVGWVYFRYLHGARWHWPIRRRQTEVEMPRWLEKIKKTGATPASYHVNLTHRDNLRAEVDRILDKNNSQGFGALTTEEKHTLDEARDLLSRH